MAECSKPPVHPWKSCETTRVMLTLVSKYSWFKFVLGMRGGYSKLANLSGERRNGFCPPKTTHPTWGLILCEERPRGIKATPCFQEIENSGGDKIDGCLRDLAPSQGLSCFARALVSKQNYASRVSRFPVEFPSGGKKSGVICLGLRNTVAI